MDTSKTPFASIGPLFSRDGCRQIIDAAEAGERAAARIFLPGKNGIRTAPELRRTDICTVPADILSAINAVVARTGATVESWLNCGLRRFQDVEVLRYDVGSFFVYHRDIPDGFQWGSEARHGTSGARRASMTIPLNDDFEGGQLRIYLADGETYDPPMLAGHGFFFRSDVPHEVLPVTAGVRYALVAWYE